MAEIEVGGFEPERYADAILEIHECMEGQSVEGVDGPYTPGQEAARQWIAILIMVVYDTSNEGIDPARA